MVGGYHYSAYLSEWVALHGRLEWTVVSVSIKVPPRNPARDSCGIRHSMGTTGRKTSLFPMCPRWVRPRWPATTDSCGWGTSILEVVDNRTVTMWYTAFDGRQLVGPLAHGAGLGAHLQNSSLAYRYPPDDVLWLDFTARPDTGATPWQI